MKKLLFIASIVFFTNCSNDTLDQEALGSQEIQKEEQRVTFENFESFNLKIDELSKLSIENLAVWVEENNPNSLLKSENNESSLPNSLMALFNNNNELIIGNKIIWLNADSLFEFALEDSIKLETLKLDTNNLTPIGKIELSDYEFPKGEKLTNNAQNLMDKKILNAGSHRDSRHQKEFLATQITRCDGYSYPIDQIFKYVHELQTVRIIWGEYSITKLYLKLKLEYYRGRRRWGAASEARTIATNLNVTAQLRYNGGVSILPTTEGASSKAHNLTYYCSNDQEILLNSSFYYDSDLHPQWHVTTSGTITHSLNGGAVISGPVPPAQGRYTWVNNAVW